MTGTRHQPDQPTDVTRLLRHLGGDGDREAKERLLLAVYDNLRRMASARMRGQRRGHTLEPTALVHEAWMKIERAEQEFESRAHFFAVAALAMRQILINHAQEKAAQKRGGDARRVTFSDVRVVAEDPDIDLLALDRALDALAEEDERLSRVVHLRYFTGLSIEETAEALGISPATVKRDWAYARAWLHDRMSG